MGDLLRASEARGIPVRVAPFPGLEARLGGSSDPSTTIAVETKDSRKANALNDVGAILVRTMPLGTLEQVIFRMDALNRVAALGVPVLNAPRSLESAIDKFLGLALLERAGLDVPETWVGESANGAQQAFEQLGGDVAVKPLFGSEGRGLVRVSDPELAHRVFQSLERIGAVLYLQRIVDHGGLDVRLLLLDGQILGAIRRQAVPGDWRTNLSQGGRAILWPDPDPEVVTLARRASEAIGATLAGVDLAWDRRAERWVVFEVNAVPGWRGLARVCDLDVAETILCYLRERAAN